jgi:hypothetical protein
MNDDNPQSIGKSWIGPLTAVCLKKPHPDGCFDYDKVITVRRFSPTEPTKPLSC